MLIRLPSLLLTLLCCGLLVACPGGRDDDDTADDDDSAGGVDGADADGDGFCLGDECDDEDLDPGDCDDTDPDVNPDASETCNAVDDDCDGRIDENFDADQDGFVDIEVSDCVGTYPPELLDCNDQIAAINPEAEETCDGNDTDCNGLIDDGLDTDFDGFRVCDAPADCDDTDPLIYPGAPETCDGDDENCDGVVDNGIGTEFLDQDADGYTPCADDCDDNPVDGWLSYPGAQEACDEKDNDCDGVEDNEELLDVDGDGAAGPYPGCLQVFGEVDCDDNDATVFPGNAEICDTLDNNCDGQIDENLDFDNDGFTSCQGDCDSLNANVNPNAIESCDGVDNDCDGTIDEGFDTDGDGQSDCAGDCDPANPLIYTGAPELCDNLDNDCDGSPGPDEADIDGDTYSACDGDCDETSADISPAATEICNTIDDDCDGVVPADELDDDNDGFIGCTPSACVVTLVNDVDDTAFWDTFTALDATGLDTEIANDAEAAGWLADATNYGDGQVMIWHTGYRELSQSEYDALSGWVAAGGNLIVTGEGVLYEELLAGDDDDSAGDDDDSAGDDDDSAGDDDDSAGTGGSGATGVDPTLMADLIGSLTVGLGPETASCTVSSTATPVTSGPYGSWTNAFAFSASSTVHDNAYADTNSGAVRVASVGSRAKIIWRPVLNGGVVAYWNGNLDLGDWDPAHSADLGAMLRNMVDTMNAGCGGTLQGGDCDDTDPTLYPGSCP